MRILFVTGRLAREALREAVEAGGLRPGEYGILVADVDVAAFITSDLLGRLLEENRELVEGFDLVVVPGFTHGSLRELSKRLGVKIVKGPRFLQDIPLFLEALREGIEFSPDIPADELIVSYRDRNERELLERVRKEAWAKRIFHVGKGGSARPVSRVRPLVVAEITFALAHDPSHVVKIAKRLEEEGADVIVLGGDLQSPKPGMVAEIVGALKSGVSCPIGVDSYYPEEVESALEKDVDMIFVSREEVLRLLVDRRLMDIPLVLTPNALGASPGSIGDFDVKLEELRRRGFKKIIADPVLKPPLTGLLDSLIAYRELRSRLPDVPLLMGVGNVTEFIDADCHGVNALLASIAVEIGVEMLLMTEASAKTRGCVGELVKAVNLASMAWLERRPPKDFNLNLLYLKNKRSREKQGVLPPDAVRVGVHEPIKIDPSGFFRIWVDRVDDCIVLEHYRYGSSTPDAVLCGRDPVSLGREAVSRGLVGLSDHAVYLGSELQKAWIALKLGRDYVQDEELF
jgi:dihydropteroate synthase-like protein